MKTLISIRWYLFAVAMITALLDLIALTSKSEFGAGFVFAFAIFLFIVLYHPKKQ